MGTNFQAPKGGPFNEALLPSAYQSRQQFTGLEGTLGSIAGVASKFLEGLSRGRLAKHAQKENQKLEALRTVGSFVESRLNDPRYTDDYKRDLQQRFLGIMGQTAAEGLAPEKGEPRDKSLIGTLKSGARDLLVGMTGGDFKGEAINTEKLLDLMRVEADSFNKEENLIEPQVNGAVDSLEASYNRLQSSLGREPFRHEVQQLPEWSNLSRVIRRHRPKDADGVLDEISGRFQEGPKPYSAEAERMAAGEAAAADVTPAPPAGGGRFFGALAGGDQQGSAATPAPPISRLGEGQLREIRAQGVKIEPVTAFVGPEESRREVQVWFNPGTQHSESGYYEVGTNRKVTGEISLRAPEKGEVREASDGTVVRVNTAGIATPITFGDGKPLKGRALAPSLIQNESGFYLVDRETGSAKPIKDASGKVLRPPSRTDDAKKLATDYGKFVISLNQDAEAQRSRLEAERRRRKDSLRRSNIPQFPGAPVPYSPEDLTAREAQIDHEIDAQLSLVTKSVKANLEGARLAYGQAPSAVDFRQTPEEPPPGDYTGTRDVEKLSW